MTVAGGTIQSFGVGDTLVFADHYTTSLPVLDGKRTVLLVLSGDTQSVTGITDALTGNPGGMTAQGTHTGQGHKISLFDKICGPAEPIQYAIALSPAAPTWGVVFLTDFDTDGAAIRATDYADSASGSSLTLPSLTVTDADDIWTFVWNNPDDTTVGRLSPQSPLTGAGLITRGALDYAEAGTESWRSSSATGTRSYATAAGTTHEGALGVIMIVGEYAAAITGGWGVGQIRMDGA